MSAVILDRRTACTEAGPPARKIERVAPGTSCTLVVKQGSRMERLRFNETITVSELRAHCNGQFGWEGLDALDIVVDGRRHAAEAAHGILLAPEVKRVGFGVPTGQPCLKTVEFTRHAPSKG